MEGYKRLHDSRQMTYDLKMNGMKRILDDERTLAETEGFEVTATTITRYLSPPFFLIFFLFSPFLDLDDVMVFQAVKKTWHGAISFFFLFFFGFLSQQRRYLGGLGVTGAIGKHECGRVWACRQAKIHGVVWVSAAGFVRYSYSPRNI